MSGLVLPSTTEWEKQIILEVTVCTVHVHTVHWLTVYLYKVYEYEYIWVCSIYTLSHLENDGDVSAYSRGRGLLILRAHLVFFLTCSKRNTRIDTSSGVSCGVGLMQGGSLRAFSEVTVVLGMRQSTMLWTCDSMELNVGKYQTNWPRAITIH